MRRPALAALALLALSVVLTPWYELASYRPSGWDATWWARIALALALTAALALRAGRSRPALLLSCGAGACVALRTILPPDFGFDFEGLEVGTGREWGLWLALLCAAVAVGALAREVRPGEPGREPAPSA